MIFLLLFLLTQSHFILCTEDNVVSRENENYFSIGAHLNADSFSKILRKDVNSNLAVDTFQNFLNDLDYFSVSIDTSLLTRLTSELDLSFSGISSLLPSLVSNTSTKVPLSCNSIHDVIKAGETQPCYIFHESKEVSENVNSLFPVHSPYISSQFMYSNSVQLEYPAQFIGPQSILHWSSILSHLISHPKKVLLVADLGSITSDVQLHSLKNVLLHLLNIAIPTDFYSILIVPAKDIRISNGFSEKFCQMEKFGCKEGLLEVVHSIRLSDDVQPSNHSLALENSFRSLFAEKPKLDTNHYIQYISRGAISELTDAAQVMNTLARAVLKYLTPVKINTILIADENRAPVIWSTEFMRNVAKQNFSRYKQSIADEVMASLNSLNHKIVEGEAIVVHRSISSVLNLKRMQVLLENFENSSKENFSPKWHVHFANRGETGDVIRATISQTLTRDNRSVLVGFDVDLTKVLNTIMRSDEVLLAPHFAELQVFVTSLDGTVLYSSSDWSMVLLSELDDWTKSSDWLIPYISNEEESSGDFEVVNRKGDTICYYWRKLSQAPFILFIRSLKPLPLKTITLAEKPKQIFSLNHMVYNSNVKQQPCTKTENEKASVFLPRTAFSNKIPTSTAKMEKDSWVYLTDTLGLIRSDLVGAGIREEIGVLRQLAAMWIKLTEENKGKSMIIRRFAATRRGTMVVFPAEKVMTHYEPSEQAWFSEAVSSPGSAVVTGPRLDSVFGDVVTISIAVILPNSTTEAFAVVAMDVPSVYLKRLLSQGVSSCGQTRRCILFSPAGSVLFANDQVDRGRKASDVLERYHLSHLEPLLTSQMTENARLVEKKRCRTNKSVKRYFKWNLSYTRVHTTACGSPTSRMGGPIQSEVLRVPHTHVFIAMINTTCSRTAVTVFCPCSVHDQRCLFCGRFDSSECECPCSCPIQLNSNLEEDMNMGEPISFCHPTSRNDVMIETSPTTASSQCPVDCSALLHPSSCVSSLGCEWCRFNSNGGPIRHAFCSPTTQCYQGVQGRSTKRSQEFIFDNWTMGTPLGPLAAGIMTIFVVLVIIVYCYRTQVTRLISRRGLPDGAPLFPVERNNFESDGVFREEKISLQLASFERQAPALLRPSHPASDHGYSTMTDRNTAEETESAASTCTDGPQLLNLKPAPPSSIIATSVDVHVEPSRIVHEIIST